MTQNQIHVTAIVDPQATLGKNVSIGPYSVVGPNVVLGDNVTIKSHVVLDGHTTIGENTEIYPFASIGTAPQDLKFKGEKSTLIIGKNNKIREHVTMNPGTEGDKMSTIVGDNCLFMVGAHVAHDCIVGNNVIMANNATLAGHVEVGDFAIIGGLSAVRQFIRIGAHAMIGGMSGIERNIIPYGQAAGERASLQGLNLIGLKRRGFERDDINTLRSAYRLIFSSEGTLSERLKDAEQRFGENAVVQDIIDFIRTEDKQGICQPKHLARDQEEAAA
jgi:UDP-N-acetylglucosamine acyltransferase